ncbi:MarR family transcriptional regulator [Nocardia sp. NPDC004068]|uniref:MarR family transcriptional regulator n=1 Tax=Nocardia sp. NPDC004068 TaxID=3364303 RepID=UPI0036884A81
MPKESADELRELAGRESQAMQAAVDAVDEAAARVLGVNRTDLRCLEILIRDPATPGRLATELNLTSGSVTTMLDRLAKLDYIARTPDPDDRRKTLITITERARETAWRIYGPIAEEGARELADFTPTQLRTVLEYLRRSRELQERHRARIEQLPKRKR